MTGPATFSNGRTAARIEAAVATRDRGLEIRDPKDGLLLALWAYDDLRAVEGSPQRLRLTCLTDPDARLTVQDASLMERLRQFAPALRLRPQRLPMAAVWGLGLMAAILGGVLLWQGLWWGARPLARLIPFSWETRLAGDMAKPLVRQLGGPCSRPAGQAALDGLTRRLVEAGNLPSVISVEVVNSPEVNAFALPGGRVLLLNGLIKEAQSPDEVAAVLAHEFSHVALRHITEQTIRHAGLGVVVMLLTGEPSGLTAGAIIAMTNLSFSRETEAEADAMGLTILNKADISAQGMGIFFHRLADKEKTTGHLPVFLSDHPSAASRAEIPDSPPFSRPAMGFEAWLALRAICN